MAGVVPRLIKVTYGEHCPLEIVDLAIESGFGGFGTTYRGNHERVLYIRPHRESYETLKAQLKVMEEGGELSFVEE